MVFLFCPSPNVIAFKSIIVNKLSLDWHDGINDNTATRAKKREKSAGIAFVTLIRHTYKSVSTPS
jgi:hypothetical protein